MSNVRCWNCGMDFEVVSSAQNITKQILSPQFIEEVLLANMFDGERGGMIEMKVDSLVSEVADILSEYI